VKKPLAVAFVIALGAACAASPMAIDRAKVGSSTPCAPIQCEGANPCSPAPPSVCVEKVERPWYRFGDASRITLTKIDPQVQCVRILQDDARQFADHDLGYDDAVSRLNRRQLELEPAGASVRFLVAASPLDATDVKQALGNLVGGTGSPLEFHLFQRSCSDLCVGSRGAMTVRLRPNGQTSVDIHKSDPDDCAQINQRSQNRDGGAPAVTASGSAAVPAPPGSVPSASPAGSASGAPPAASGSASPPAPAASGSAAQPL
jgi:hypothetical protein